MTHSETEEVSKEYKKAFNAGYQMSEHEPELLDKILKSPNQDKEYFKAMVAGKKQYELERTQQRATEKRPSQTPSKDRNDNPRSTQLETRCIIFSRH